MSSLPPPRPCRSLVALLLALMGCSGPGDPREDADRSAASRPPNLILVMTDDQGFGDFGSQGNPILDTPRLDELARTSASLGRFYVCPVCSPTRASLMTGRYHYRTRVVDTWVGRSMMEPAEVTVAEVLRDAGYRTGIFGKWHLGDCYPMRPGDQGFDESLVHYGGGLAQPSEPPENQRRYTDPVLVHNGLEVATRGYCTDVYFDAALDFIEDSREQQRPFFVYLPTNAPHTPLHDVPEDLRRKYVDRGADDATARVFAMIENIDHNVGRLLDRLDEWQLARNTLLVFLQDNGPQGARFNAGLRGHKGDVYEGGVRSVFWARWPGMLEPGVASEQVCAHIDVMPTLLAAAGIPSRSVPALDGRNLLPLLRREVDSTGPERLLFLQAHRGNEPRAGFHCTAIGSRYKLVRNSGFDGPAAVDTRPPAWELFDLIEDPGETRDLASGRPDLVESMGAAYDSWFADVSTTRPDNFAPPRIVIGEGGPALTRLSKQDWRVEDSAGWGQFGHWSLQVNGAASIRATVLLADPVGGRLEVLSGDRVVGTEVFAASRSMTIEDLRLPAGECDLSVRVVTENGPVGVYQLLLERTSH